MRKRKKEYLDNIEEWNEHQYDPGYYTGGNIPHFITEPGNKFGLGWLYIISAFMLLVIYILVAHYALDRSNLIVKIIVGLSSAGLFLLYLLVGIRLLIKAKKFMSKKMVIILTLTLVAFSIIALSINCFDYETQKIVSGPNEISFRKDNGRGYILIHNNNSINKIQINSKDYSYLFKKFYANYNSNTKVKIVYITNKLFNRNGKLVRIELLK